MAQQWYYARAGQKTGPVTPKQLRGLAASGTLRPTDLVWTEGMTEWKAALSVKGLYPPNGPRIQAGPPPLPKERSTEAGASGIRVTGSASSSRERVGPRRPVAEITLGRIKPDDSSGWPEQKKAGIADENRCLPATEVLRNRLEVTPRQTSDASTVPSGTDDPPSSPLGEDATGPASKEAGRHFLWELLGSVAFTLAGFGMIASGERSFSTISAVFFFGTCSVVFVVMHFGERSGWFDETPQSLQPPGEIVPDSEEDQADLVSPDLPPWAVAPAWLSRFSVRDLGLSVITLLLVGLFLQFCTIDDARPFASPLFWYWGVSCLVLPGVVHRRAAATPFGQLLACLLRSIVFFVCGFFGGVFMSLLLRIMRCGDIDSTFPLTFFLASAPTLLIPNRLDVLLPVALASLFAANRMTTSRSAGLCHRCRGTGYCQVCRGQRVHLGGKCLDCLESGMCAECSGTGGRSVL